MAETFTVREAAQQLGLTERTFKYHYQQRHVQADYKIGNSLIFTRQTLEQFAQRYMNEEHMTIAEIAQKYTVSIAAVKGHVRRQAIKPSGKRGLEFVYSQQNVELIGSLLKRT